MKENKKFAEIVNEKINIIMNNKKHSFFKILKKNGKYTSTKKVIYLVNQEITKKINEIKKLSYKEIEYFNENGITLILNIDNPLENEESELELKKHFNDENCFFQYVESKNNNYICVGTKF